MGGLIGQPNMASNITWMVLLDYANSIWIFSWCIRWSVWQAIQYYANGPIGLGGLHLNIQLVYLVVSLTWHPILHGWCCRIRRMPSGYSVGISSGQPDRPSNIISMVGFSGFHLDIQFMYPPNMASNITCMVLSDHVDSISIFSWCIQWSVWHTIQYYLNGSVRLGGFHLNIQLVYPVVSLTAHPILSEWCHHTRQIMSEYLVGVSSSQPNRLSNIISMVPSD